MNADGTQLAQLTHFDVPYEAGDTNWSSDGKKIAFQWDTNGKKQSDPNAYAEGLDHESRWQWCGQHGSPVQ